MKFLVQRGADGKTARIEIEDEDAQVHDLLEASRAPLKFSEDAALKAYREGEKKHIHVSTNLTELKDVKLLIIKDQAEDAKKKEETFEKAEKKLKDAQNHRDKIADQLKPGDERLEKEKDKFRNNFDQVGPDSKSNQHDLLDSLKDEPAMKGGNNANEPPEDLEEAEEMKILQRKLNTESLIPGYRYEINRNEYCDLNQSVYEECSYSSEEKRKNSQKKIQTTSDWSSWHVEGGFSGWGVTVSAGGGQDKSSSSQEGSKNVETEETKVAIVTRTNFHQMKMFRVTIRLADKAIREAKNILKMDMYEKKAAIDEFCKKYCSYVYTGQFVAGGWFRVVATATSTKTMKFSALSTAASKKLQSHWEASISGYGAKAGGGQNTGTSNSTETEDINETQNSTVQVMITKESAPGNTSTEAKLEEEIKSLRKCTIFPPTGADKSHFTPINEIITRQAQEMKDDELLKVADLLEMYLSVQKVNMGSVRSRPYVVLLGDVGTGKSTIVEKLTGESGRSSDGFLSATRVSKPLWVMDGSMIICDTPGSNALQEKLEHNEWIAAAFSIAPVSQILIIVKAETRIDNVIDGVRKYAERLLDLPMEVVGVLVTHMDTVAWSKADFLPLISNELGIENVVFSGLNTPSTTLLADIHQQCKQTFNINVNHENFLKIFKIHNNNLRILRSADKKVVQFRELKKGFDEARKAFHGKDLVDLIFEFQAYMGEQIVVMQKQMAEENQFTFYGDGAANEAGHIANMTNQLRLVLYDIRVEATGFQSEHGVVEARRCPHCNLVWTKIEGCEGETECGSRPTKAIDVRDEGFGVLGTFSFQWIGNRLQIRKSGEKSVKQTPRDESPGFGCGKKIVWKEMPPVSLPADLKEAKKVGTEDVASLPNSHPGVANFNQARDRSIADKIDQMKIEPRQNP